jgi:hypothetical protein
MRTPATTHPPFSQLKLLGRYLESGLALGAVGDVHQQWAVIKIQPSSASLTCRLQYGA